VVIFSRLFVGFFYINSRSYRRAGCDEVRAMELCARDLQHPEGGGGEAGPPSRAGGRGAQGARHPLHPGRGRQGKWPQPCFQTPVIPDPRIRTSDYWTRMRMILNDF